MYYPFINERNYVYINFCNIIILYFIIQFVRALLVLQKDIEGKNLQLQFQNIHWISFGISYLYFGKYTYISHSEEIKMSNISHKASVKSPQ